MRLQQGVEGEGNGRRRGGTARVSRGVEEVGGEGCTGWWWRREYMQRWSFVQDAVETEEVQQQPSG